MSRVRVGFVLLVCLSALCIHAERLQRWFYYPVNLWVDSNITNLAAVLNRAAQSGYTHMLLSDSKFSRLGDMDAHYFTNVNYIRNLAASLGIQIVPAVFPIGYSNDLLFQDPNLIEALPVTNSLLVVSNGTAYPQADPPVVLRGGDFSNLALWDWKDPTVVADNGTARVTDPNGQIARIVQTVQVSPFRQYHLSVRVKTQAFLGTPEVKVLAGGIGLTYNPLGVAQTQDWRTHHIVFNSLTNRSVTIYLGCWDGTTGSLWWDDAVIEETVFLNLVRRPGAPLVVRMENGPALTEGADFQAFKDPLMGVKPWNGSYDVYHAPPLLQVNATNGTRLRATWSFATTVDDDQAMICPSEPATLALLREQARRVHAAFGSRGYMMSHDEIRVMNWCPACQARNLDAGTMLADNVRTCIGILREINPGGDIYVWSDMFDPYHNAHNNYYLVRGDLTNSWLGLDPAVTVLPWYYGQRTNSLSFFSARGHRQVIAGYYDGAPSAITNWLNTAKAFPGLTGVMYTTWANSYGNLESFSGFVSDFEIHNSWQLGLKMLSGAARLEFPTLAGHGYTVFRSADLLSWNPWTNLTANAAIGRCPDPAGPGPAFYRVMTPP